jgi:ATP-dependent helicase YprA (DUF1998 family)
MKPEKQRLIHELLDDESRQSSHLLAGVRVLRRRRFWRTARRGGALALVLAAAVVWLEQGGLRHAAQTAPAPVASPSVETHQQSLSDDQLLALFPDTPVALATLADGRKRLIFPRPEDEARFARYP